MTLIFTTVKCSGGKLPACTFSIKTSQISFQTRQTATYQHHSMYGQFFRSVSCSLMRVSPFNQHERRHSVSPSRSNVVIHLHRHWFHCGGYLVSLLSLYLSTPRGGSVQRVFPKSHRFNLLLTHFSVRLYKLGSEGEFVLVADLVWPKNKQKWNKCTFFFFSSEISLRRCAFDRLALAVCNDVSTVHPASCWLHFHYICFWCLLIASPSCIISLVTSLRSGCVMSARDVRQKRHCLSLN